MVRRATSKEYKLSYKWKGPRKIIEVISESAYAAQKLINGTSETVHYSRLRHIRASSANDASRCKRHAVHTEPIYEKVEAILETQVQIDVLYADVRWSNPDNSDDCTWQPFHELFQDVPDMVRAYVRDNDDDAAGKALENFEHTTTPSSVLQDLKDSWSMWRCGSFSLVWVGWNARTLLSPRVHLGVVLHDLCDYSGSSKLV